MQHLQPNDRQDWPYIFDLSQTLTLFANLQPVAYCFLSVATSCVCTLATDDLLINTLSSKTPSNPSSHISINGVTQCWTKLPVTLWCIPQKQNWGLQITFLIAVLQLQDSTRRLSLTSAVISNMLYTWLIINSFFYEDQIRLGTLLELIPSPGDLR